MVEQYRAGVKIGPGPFDVGDITLSRFQAAASLLGLRVRQLTFETESNPLGPVVWASMILEGDSTDPERFFQSIRPTGGSE